MQVILSHTNLDFDGLASMIAAGKLYPDAMIVLPTKVSPEVHHFLAIYKDTFPFKRPKEISWDKVKNIILVDTNSLSRLGDLKDLIPDGTITYTVFDHHPETDSTVPYSSGSVEKTGAAVTILAEMLMEKEIAVSPFEATVFSLGVYSDTGAFTYDHTTSRDLAAGAFFLRQGANLKVIDQFREAPLKDDQQTLFQQLLENSELISLDGVEIIVASWKQTHYTGHLAHITRKLLQVTGADAAFSIAEMGKKTFITARAVNERINVLPVMRSLEGGGHAKAASASLNEKTADDVRTILIEKLPDAVSPSLTAKDMMSSPVRVVAPETDIETVSKMLYRYGHTGFPVVEDDKLVGVISRRDADKALHHQLGHAPVKGFMSHKPVTIGLHEKIETIRELMIEDHVGRLPVIDNGQLVGIVSRSDVIQAMHGKTGVNISYSSRSAQPLKRQVTETMRKHLSPTVFQLLELIGEEAEKKAMKAYLIGGMIRDVLLERENEDMDIVVEGDGIALALHLQERYGGKVRKHDEFKTAVWRHPSGFKIDLTSARMEYYDFPAALPKVELSTIKEDLYRRDFTINAMGVCLNRNEFGELLDYFHGFEDLNKGKLRVLYNLSFVEDPTRILRALRFESRFGFSMDEQTERLAHQSANTILSVSKPRVSNELIRLFNEEDAVKGTKRLYELSLHQFIFNKPAYKDLSLQKISRFHMWHKHFTEAGVSLSKHVWMCYMLFLTDASPVAFSDLEGFCLSKEDLKTLKDLRDLADAEFTINLTEKVDVSTIHTLFNSTHTEPLMGYFTLLSADDSFFSYLLKREKLTPLITGNDLIEKGLKPGRHFKEILLEAENRQLASPDLSKKNLLEQIIRKHLD